MRIAIFGAAGRTGRYAVDLALSRGNDVVAFVRDRSRLHERDRLRIVEGDARVASAVEDALSGADAVVSVLSLARPEAEPEHSEATRAVVAAAVRSRVRRLVVTANNDVLTDREITGEYAPFAREHRRNRETVRDSGLDWTILAAPWVTDDEPLGAYDAVVDERGPGRRISAPDLALAVVDAVERDEWTGHVVGVSSS